MRRRPRLRMYPPNYSHFRRKCHRLIRRRMLVRGRFRTMPALQVPILARPLCPAVQRRAPQIRTKATTTVAIKTKIKVKAKTKIKALSFRQATGPFCATSNHCPCRLRRPRKGQRHALHAPILPPTLSIVHWSASWRVNPSPTSCWTTGEAAVLRRRSKERLPEQSAYQGWLRRCVISSSTGPPSHSQSSTRAVNSAASAPSGLHRESTAFSKARPLSGAS